MVRFEHWFRIGLGTTESLLGESSEVGNVIASCFIENITGLGEGPGGAFAPSSTAPTGAGIDRQRNTGANAAGSDAPDLPAGLGEQIGLPGMKGIFVASTPSRARRRQKWSPCRR